MAEEESQRQSSGSSPSLSLDTTITETASVDSAVSHPSKTIADSGPNLEPPQSPTDSGSEYSQPQTPNASRPTSMRPESFASANEDIPTQDGSRISNQAEPLEVQPSTVSDFTPEDDGDETFEDVSLEDEDQSRTLVETSQNPRPASIESLGPSEGVTLSEQPQLAPPETVSHPEAPPALPEKSPERERKASRAANFSRPSPRRDTFPDLPQPDAIPQTSSQPDSSPEPLRFTDEETPTITASPNPQSPDGSDYSGSPVQSPSTPTLPVSPITPHEARMSIDSMQSIALSESSLDYDHLSSQQVDDILATPRVSSARHLRKPSSLEIIHNAWQPTRQSTFFDNTKDAPLDTPIDGPGDDDEYGFGKSPIEYGQAETVSIRSGQSSAPSVTIMDTSAVWRSESSSSLATPKRGSGSSEEDAELNWFALDKTEEQEKEDKDLPEGAEDESTAFLLARLEQENAKFSADPKSAVNKNITRVRSQSRPPSMAHLKKLVSKGDAPSIRFSMASDVDQQLPEDPPPMTELEFWAALVQDYPSTASRLPTLTTTKIRAGIPPPLRGVVWTSMAGAREKNLEEAFEKLQNEQSPYEGIINKDVGRSFPGVELFRDAEGEGQKMLGRVLKCFSLHDQDIGYCQGLGFLVGPLLMNMGEKEAFCVLVRLMDHYALRPSFLPSLSGLHMRIFQFSTLLAQHHPELSEHLTNLGVEPAYLSQWFLSCFAVTCPLPMLFRIYDVIFAEGANETVMRVAMALFRRNEAKMMASTEFEEVMQLLLGRALWDVYGLNADDLVDDFTSLGHIITHQRLAELEKEFETKDGESVGRSAGFLPDVQAAAGRFLGRLWAPNHGHTPSKGAAAATLSPQSAEKDGGSGSMLSRPGSFLRRTPSKQSLGTINDSTSSEGTSSGAASLASTAATEVESQDARESQADSMSIKSKAESLRTTSVAGGANAELPTPGTKEKQELHTEIEDLLMALSEMQREHAQLAAMLQKEREERNDDHRVVKQLLVKLKTSNAERGRKDRRSMPPPMRTRPVDSEEASAADKRRTLPARPRPEIRELPVPQEEQPEKDNREELEGLISEVQTRLDANGRFSASFETKAQLRSTLARTREQLASAEAQVKELSERAEGAETSLVTYQGEAESLRSEVEELRARVNDDFKERTKLELTVQNMEIEMRMQAKAVDKKQRDRIIRADSSGEVPTLNKLESPSRSRTGSIHSASGSVNGLRELKLGRRDSVGSVQSIRSMKSQRQVEQPPPSPTLISIPPSPPNGPVVDALPPPPPPKEIPVADPAPVTPSPAPKHTPASSLTVPGTAGGSFGRRTSSLATQAVLATPKHEPVPDEALLLELVNAKTAEATARAEVDELKKALQVAKRRAEENAMQYQAEAASAKLEVEKAKAEADEARAEAQAARAEVFDASPLPTPMTPAVSMPVTPAPEDIFIGKTVMSPVAEGSETPIDAKKTEAQTPSSAFGGGWFWSRRTASTTKASID